ncbi:MAG: BamA/TamA family outer membrane protein [Spirosomataceae bacterium]
MRFYLLFFWLLAVTAAAQTSDSSFVVIQHIQLVGNHQTKSSIILRELDLHEGDTLRIAEAEERLEKDRRKVFNTNLFLSVKLSLTNQVAQTADLQVEVKEQWFIFPFPVFRFADRNFNEWLFQRGADLSRSIYGVNFRHRNFRGRAEELRLNLEFGFAQFFEFFYRIPYLNKSQKTGVTFGVSYSDTKNLAYRTDLDKLTYLKSDDVLRKRFYANVLFRRRSKFYDFQYLELRYTNTNLADTVARFLNPNYFLNGSTNQRFWQLSYTYTYDFRDKAQYPLRGHYLFLQANKYGLLTSDDLNQLDLLGRYSIYRPLGDKWFFQSTVGAKLSFPQHQPFSQTRGLGYGQDLVRGYELYAIDGQSYAYVRNTLRWQWINTAYDLKFLKIKQFNSFPLEVFPNLFVDAGQVWNGYAEMANSKLSNKFLIGGGVGLDFVMWYNAVMRLNYSFNAKGESGFRFNLLREF